MNQPNANVDDLLRRLLAILTPDQLALLVLHMEHMAQYSHGYTTITWRDSKPDLILHEASDKA